VRDAVVALARGDELAALVEAVLGLERADLQRAAREAPGAQRLGELVGETQVGGGAGPEGAEAGAGGAGL
jgi:hypothetical protein